MRIRLRRKARETFSKEKDETDDTSAMCDEFSKSTEFDSRLLKYCPEGDEHETKSKEKCLSTFRKIFSCIIDPLSDSLGEQSSFTTFDIEIDGDGENIDLHWLARLGYVAPVMSEDLMDSSNSQRNQSLLGANPPCLVKTSNNTRKQSRMGTNPFFVPPQLSCKTATERLIVKNVVPSIFPEEKRPCPNVVYSKKFSKISVLDTINEEKDEDSKDKHDGTSKRNCRRTRSADGEQGSQYSNCVNQLGIVPRQDFDWLENHQKIADCQNARVKHSCAKDQQQSRMISLIELIHVM